MTITEKMQKWIIRNRDLRMKHKTVMHVNDQNRAFRTQQ